MSALPTPAGVSVVIVLEPGHAAIIYPNASDDTQEAELLALVARARRLVAVDAVD